MLRDNDDTRNMQTAGNDLRESGTRAHSQGSGYYDDENQYNDDESTGRDSSLFPQASGNTQSSEHGTNDKHSTLPNDVLKTPHKVNAFVPATEKEASNVSPSPAQIQKNTHRHSILDKSKVENRRAQNDEIKEGNEGDDVPQSLTAPPSRQPRLDQARTLPTISEMPRTSRSDKEIPSLPSSDSEHISRKVGSSGKRARSMSSELLDVTLPKRVTSDSDKSDSRALSTSVITDSQESHNRYLNKEISSAANSSGIKDGSREENLTASIPPSGTDDNLKNSTTASGSVDADRHITDVPTESPSTAQNANNDKQDAPIHNHPPFTQGGSIDFKEIMGEEITTLDANKVNAEWEVVAVADQQKMDELRKKWKETNAKMQIWLKRGKEVQAEREICLLNSKVTAVATKEREAIQIRERLGKFVEYITSAQMSLMEAAGGSE